MIKFSKINSVLLTLILCLAIGNIFAQEDWKLVREDEGIKIYTKKEVGFDYKTFKGHMVLESSIANFISVLIDVEGLSNWGYKVKSSKLLEKFGDSVLIYYSEAKAPFPYKNRDGIYLNRYKWNEDSRTLLVEIEILDEYLDLNEKLVRVKGKGHWKVSELTSGKIDVIFQMQIDPGGSIPGWLANMFVTDSPHYSLLNLKEVIKKEKYQNQKIEYLN